ncbi:MAG TPA: ABC transporter permease [Candidatus Limnocylindrales bacterium]|nr:ABC transporter permease [Candidatus Limnocylindrales bacterium]
MFTYLLHRLIQMVIVLFLLSLGTYYLLGLMPGDPVELLITSNPKVKPEDIQRLKKVYGLDQPIYIRYFKWLKQVTLEGDLGFSRTYKKPTSEILKIRIWNTLKLMTLSFLLSLIIAIPIGVYSAIQQYSTFDYFANLMAFLGISVPTFWSGILAILFFSVQLQWFPAGGMFTIGIDSWLDQLKYLILPTVVLSIESISGWSRYIRSSMLEVLHEDYIRTARAKGVSEKKIIFYHAFRNALIPTVTILALSIPGLFSGALITETIFAWPGMGRLLYDSVMGSDYYVAMLCFLSLGFLTLIFNFLADILYAIVDPRIRVLKEST